MQFPHPTNSLVKRAINSRRNGKRPTNNCAYTRQETSEGLRPHLTIDNLHRRDVVVEKDAGNTARCVDALLMSLVRCIATAQRSLVRGYAVLMCFDAAL